MSVKLKINQFPSDFTYFHSDYIINLWDKYNFTEFYASSKNSYVAERLDYKNPKKGDRIIFSKNSDDADSRVGFITDTHNRTNMFPLGMPYRFFMLEGDICLGGQDMNIDFCKLTDNSQGRIFSHTLSVSDNRLGDADLEPDKWYHIRAYFDCKNLCSYTELDGKFVSKNEIMRHFTAPTFYEFSVCGGIGKVMIRNWEFTGLSKPAQINDTIEIVHSTQFPDEALIREYLSDKIAFHGDAGVIFRQGKKEPLGSVEYRNDDLYVPAEYFNGLFGTTYKGIIPVKEKANEIGLFAVNSAYGKMVIISKNDDLIETSNDDFPWFDSQYYSENLFTYPILSFSDAQEISNYIFFDRPSPEKLKKDFFEKSGHAPHHPRLFLNDKRIDELREKREKDPNLNSIITELISDADKALEHSSVEYKYDDGMRTLRNYYDNFCYLDTVAFAYIITGDSKYSDKVIKELMNVCAFPDLNPCHIIDTGSWLSVISLCYDWCYDAMSAEEREKASTFIIERGIAVQNRAYYATLPSGGLGLDFQLSSWFVRWKSNYIPYTQGGLTMACLAVFEEEPELCGETLANTLRSWEYALYGLYPDGVWLEGKIYTHIVYYGLMKAMAALVSCVGSSYGILDYPGVENGLKTLTSYDSLVAAFCFGDDSCSEPFSTSAEYLRFFGNYYNNDFLIAWRDFSLRNKEQWYKINAVKAKIGGIYRKGGDVKPEIYDAVFWSDKEISRPQFERVNIATGGEIFTYHEDIFDKNAVFVAAAGGPTRHYHFHEDCGDFLICKNGELWTWEFGQGDYNLGTIFTRFSGRAEAHNTLVINPSCDMSQKLQSFAPISDYAETENGAYAVIDMTEVYSHHGAESLLRRFDISNGVITVTDDMYFNKQIRGYWVFNTPADIILTDENTVELSQNGKRLYLNLKIDGEKTGKLILGKSRPLEESPKLDGDLTANTEVNSVKLYFEGMGKIKISAKFLD